jgi:MFS family permease
VFAAGVAGTVASLLTGSVAVFFAAAVVSGLGFGAAFLGAMATVTRGVAPGERAGLLSSVFVVGYLAYSVPAILAGFAAAEIGLQTAAVVYGAVVIGLALVTVTGLQLRRRSDRRQAAPVAGPAEVVAA